MQKEDEKYEYFLADIGFNCVDLGSPKHLNGLWHIKELLLQVGFLLFLT